MIQSGYYIQDLAHLQCHPEFNKCNQIKKLDFMRTQFGYTKNNKLQVYWILFFDQNNQLIKDREIPYGLKSSAYIYNNEFWPNGFGDQNQTHKSSAFWPKEYYFLYIINGKTPKENAFLATNSLLNYNWSNSWTYTTLKESEGMLFTAAFW